MVLQDHTSHEWILTGGRFMIRTITMGTYVSVQGVFLRALPNGKIAVKVGQKVYEGKPV